MNFDETQRVNLLAKELQQNGLACSSSEAVEKANKMLQSTEGKKEPGEEDKLELLEKKYRSLLEQNNNLVLNEINNIKSSINSLIAEFNSVKSQLNRQELKINGQKAAEKPQVQDKIADTPKKELHPKQGEFTSEDVSVEKFFYFGQK